MFVPQQKPVRLRVHSLSGELLADLSMLASNTVQQAQELVAEQDGNFVPSRRFQLVFQGKVLDRSSTLAELGLTDWPEVEVQVIQRSIVVADCVGPCKDQYSAIKHVVLVGDSGTGKSHIIERFIHDRFVPTLSQTIGVDFRTQILKIEGEGMKFTFWDTSSGHERYRNITCAYYRGASGIMMVFDLTSWSSFENLRLWIKASEEHGSRCVVRCLVGSKADLVDERAVSENAIKSFAKEHRLPYFEVSAKTGSGLRRLFEALASEIYEDHLEKEAGLAIARMSIDQTPRRRRWLILLALLFLGVVVIHRMRAVSLDL